jgi:hypothetical protein
MSSRLFRIGGPFDKVLVVVAAGVVVTLVSSIGQGLLWQWLDVSNAADPIGAVNRFGNMSIWFLHPLAAILAGVIVSRLRVPIRMGLMATAISLAPLWVVWVEAGISSQRAASVVLCLGLAGLPVILKHSARMRTKSDLPQAL